jgi:carbon-monoxide dehydrogenase medium subunit
MTIRSFELLEPRSLQEAAGLLTEYGDDARVIAGGTTLVILMKQRALHYPYLVDLRLIPGLGEIKRDKDGLCIGAMASHRAVESSAVVRERFPALAEAFRHIGNVRVRQTASVGGNLAHADSRLDPPPPLLVLNAAVTLHGPAGGRKIALKDFFSGLYETALEPAEILVDVRIPNMPENSRVAYQRFVTLSANDWPCLGVAALLVKENGRCAELRLAVGGLANTPLLISGLEWLKNQTLDREVIEKVQDTVEAQISPSSDFRGSEWYKRRMARLFVRRIIEQLDAAYN